MSHIRSRFQRAADKLAADYTTSLPFDRRLYRHDIDGSIAHVKMLDKQGIISGTEAATIIGGLAEIREEIARGDFVFKPEQEDIHMAIEARLLEKVGEVGGKLHTARSRNDQVALDLRLFTREAVRETTEKLKDLQAALLGQAEAGKGIVMPGYTHLQPAQPVLLAHHLLAYFEMLQRDRERFADCFRRTDVMPLGSGALAGVTYNIDREYLAAELGFSGVTRNSIDAVADRDFVLEYQAAASICMMHVSRMAEEIVLWSTAEFGFIELDEAYATASSIMPQKKNPDVAELGRGRAGRVFGRLAAMLATMKGLPLAYNRDMQEDKEGLFDTVDTLITTLGVFRGMVATWRVNTARMGVGMKDGYILATDLADYLVKKGETFRRAHDIVGRLVSETTAKGKTFGELSRAEYKEFSPLFGEDVYAITVETSLAARNVAGGTAPERVEKALTAARKMIKEPEGK